MFGLIRKFNRCAVHADQKWLKTVSEIEAALIPGLDIKGFSTDEEAAAEAWLEENQLVPDSRQRGRFTGLKLVLAGVVSTKNKPLTKAKSFSV